MSDSSFSDSSDLDDISEYEMIMEFNNEDQDEAEAVPMRTYINRFMGSQECLVALIVCIGNGLIVRNHGTGQYGRGANKDITVLIIPHCSRPFWADNEPCIHMFKTGNHLIEESVRKDVERAFGVLQGRWRIIAQPARAWTVNKLRRIMYTCIILHNMILKNQRFRTKEDDVAKISTSIFVTNFPESFMAKDLFLSCKQYGHVVDAFIPTKRSKPGKKIWLYVNIAKYNRNPVNSSNPVPKSQAVGKKINSFSEQKFQDSKGNNSFAQVLKGQVQSSFPHKAPSVCLPSTPVMVIDDACLVSHELDNFVMGEVRQFASINNLHKVLSTEGFANVQLAYLGGFWVMIKLHSPKAKLKFLNHKGVASWFSHLCDAQQDFVAHDRIVWVDIEGVPLHAWTRNTFLKIGSKWGEVMEVDDENDDLFARKRLCIRTKHPSNILDSFKIIVKGKTFNIRAKELFVWSPSFSDAHEGSQCSDDESFKGEAGNVFESSKPDNTEVDSDCDAVSDTFFGDNEDEKEGPNDVVQPSIAKKVSADPFKIYDLLNKCDKNVVDHQSEPVEACRSNSKSVECNSHIFEEVVNSNSKSSPKLCVKKSSCKEGGSILEVLDEMIKVGKAMGFAMDGCTRDMENIIGSQGEHEVIR
ncbi:RNA-directed DNA polymerase, eukaryota [Tanacetum coccineum]